MSELKQLQADVIVIAGGMSGLCASVAAAEKGMQVMVFEKSGTMGGAANMGMGFFAVESDIQRKQLDGLTVDQAFREMMEYNHWRADARLIRKLYQQSGDTVKWIQNMGVEFLGAFPYFKDSNATWHLPKVGNSNKPTERGATILVKALYARAQELGVQFFFNTPVKQITKDEEGWITGVIAASEETTYEASADAVIVATGGFGDNPQMILDNLGYHHGEDLFSFRIPGLAGDGIRMAWEVGAGRSPMNIEMTYEAPGFPGGNVTDCLFRQPNLMVNLDGLRFINEEIMCNTPFTGNAINLQKKRTGISILTDEICDSYAGRGLDYLVHHKDGVFLVDNWRRYFDAYFGGTEGYSPEKAAAAAMMGLNDPNAQMFFQADSPAELAEAVGMNVDNFVATVEEYNRYCDTGRDEFFGKKPEFLKPIRGKKYYAMKYFPAGYGSLGGIKVNDNLQVVTPDGDPIPGLYGAGTDVCAIFGDTYNFYMPGSTMGFAINSGRMAGSNAADYLNSDAFE